MSNEYQSVERVFRLLLLLSNALDDGIDRAEIYVQIPAYAVSAEPGRATARMLERDLAFLERLGFAVSKLGEIRTNFEVKLTKSVRKVEIDHPEPGETAPKADCVVPFL